MDAWDDLVNTALLGTERAPCLRPNPDGLVGQLLQHVETASPHAQLLSTAAVLSTYCRAGWMPAQQIEPLPPACEPDDAPVCNARAADRLARMLAGEHLSVLPEWLALLHKAGQRPPHRHLPGLLEAARSTISLEPAVVAILGNRGRWLIRQNPQWQAIAAPEDDSVWETGTPEIRLAVLLVKRGADPAVGRQMLEAVWEQEPPEIKAVFLDALEIGLNMSDEPFLEAALDQRRKEVRKPAAKLLAMLPDSRLSQRMLQRVRPLITIAKPRGLFGLGKATARIDLNLPADCDKPMQRDGVEPKPPPEVGQKAWWLQQMLGVVPPAIFSNDSAVEPAELVAAAARHEFADALLAGWTGGCERHPEPRWAEALVEAWLTRTADASLHAHLAFHWNNQRNTRIRTLMPHVPAESRERLALSAVAKAGLSDPALAVLSGCEAPWSVTLTRTAAAAARDAVGQGGRTEDLVAAVREMFPLRMDPDLLPEIAQGWPTERQTWTWWSKDVETMLAVLQFRHDMRKEIGQ